ncbi:hypothetical protein B0H13DRAFT_2305180 [Mycena leptocephala]|nr:hypothetical protein B0H13DRAFT_2305180 [Mycena leptocephala]
MASTRRDQYPLSSTSQGQNSNKPGLTKGRTAPFSGSVSARTGPASGSFVIRGQDLQPTDVFDTLWRWLDECQAIDHKRRSGIQAPWTSDPSLRKYRFCNAYRVLDRTSQFLVTDVIEQGSQDPMELLFRVLLFNCFNRILSEPLDCVEEARRATAQTESPPTGFT